jgi:Uma2 family endonuclease
VTFVDADLLARAQHAVEDLLPKGTYVEVLEGMLVVNPPLSFSHAVVTDRLTSELKRLVPAGLGVNGSVVGVYEHDSPDAEYQVPDIVVFRDRPAGTERLTGGDVEAVVEVVSPTNRRQADYPGAVAARAARYRIPWTLIVDPDKRTLQWFHHGGERATGPAWSEGLTAEAVFG